MTFRSELIGKIIVLEVHLHIRDVVRQLSEYLAYPLLLAHGSLWLINLKDADAGEGLLKAIGARIKPSAENHELSNTAADFALEYRVNVLDPGDLVEVRTWGYPFRDPRC